MLPTPMRDQLRICGGLVLTQLSPTPVFERRDIVVEQGRIVSVLPPSADTTANPVGTIDLESSSQFVAPQGIELAQGIGATQVINASDRLVIPGLINAHFHSPGNLLKGKLAGMPLEVFMLHEVPPLAQDREDPDLIYLRTLAGAVQMLRLGITTVHDDAFHVPIASIECVNAICRAYADAGMRAIVAIDQPNVVEYTKYPFLEDLLPEDERERMRRAPLQSSDELLALYREHISRWHGAANGLIRASVSCSAPQRVTEDYLQGLAALSREHALPFNIHVLETRLQRVLGDTRYRMSLVQLLEKQRVLDPRVLLIHGIWVGETDIGLLADRGVGVAHNPVCNLRLGSGIMPMIAMRRAGVHLSLGTDEAIADDSFNLWGALKMAGLVHTLEDADYRHWPTAAQLLGDLFEGGARAVGLSGEIGVIRAGARADFCLLDLDAWNLVPANDLAGQLVYCEDGSSVACTIVDGRVVYERGAGMRTVDEAAIKREVRARMANGQGTNPSARLEPPYREMVLRAARTSVGMRRTLYGD